MPVIRLDFSGMVPSGGDAHTRRWRDTRILAYSEAGYTDEEIGEFSLWKRPLKNAAVKINMSARRKITREYVRNVFGTSWKKASKDQKEEARQAAADRNRSRRDEDDDVFGGKETPQIRRRRAA